MKCTGGQWQTTLFLQYQANSHQLCFVHCRTNCFMPLPYVMPTAPLFYSITMKTEYEPKKVLLTVDVTALVTKEDSPGRSFWDCLCLCNTYNSVLITSLLGRSKGRRGLFLSNKRNAACVCFAETISNRFVYPETYAGPFPVRDASSSRSRRCISLLIQRRTVNPDSAAAVNRGHQPSADAGFRGDAYLHRKTA